MSDVWAKRTLRKLLLQDAESLARRLSEPDRRQLREQIARARQKVESAKVLWSSEQYVEGLRLAEEGIAEALRAVELAGAAWPEDGMAASESSGAAGEMGSEPPLSGDPDARWERVLARLGAGPEELAQTRAALSGAGAGATRPTLNEEVSPQHRRYTKTAVWVAESALGRIGRLASAPSRIVASRFLRVGGVVLVIILAVAGLKAMRSKVWVTASAQYPGARFAAAHVNDGNPKTEWLLPNRTPGSVEVSFGKRSIAAVKMINSFNPPYNDRAARDVRIECLNDKQVVSTVKYTFPALVTTPTWVSVPVSCKGTNGLRVSVDTWHSFGGGLAELAWE